jgi:hypothetical protein
MPVCALCENRQDAGEACDVCGRPFPVEERLPPPVEPFPDLEPTALAAGSGSPLEPVEGLEQTRIDPVQVVGGAIEGLEPTLAQGIPDDGDTPDPAPVCRYCRTPCLPGEAFCARCGMRLPGRTGGEGVALSVVLCRDCGTPVRGAACPACGVVPSR